MCAQLTAALDGASDAEQRAATVQKELEAAEERAGANTEMQQRVTALEQVYLTCPRHMYCKSCTACVPITHPMLRCCHSADCE